MKPKYQIEEQRIGRWRPRYGEETLSWCRKRMADDLTGKHCPPLRVVKVTREVVGDRGETIMINGGES